MTTAYLLSKDRNHLDPEDGRKAAEALKNTHYYIGHDPTLTTVTPVLDLIESAVQRLGATVVVLDHFHFVTRREENEIQVQANAMQRIKNMARQYGLKFFVLGQPRKANQQNKGKVVHVSDGKGSETFFSDSDVGFGLHRDYIKKKDPDNPPKDEYDPITEIHLLKARAKGDGSSVARLMFLGAKASFVEMAYDAPPNL